MKKSLLLTFLLSISAIILANPISQIKAKQIAVNALNESDLTLNISRSANNTDLELSSLSNQQIYIFNRSDSESFAIISASDAAYPILAYSSDKAFPTENIPPSVQNFLDFYTDQIQQIEAENLPATSQITEAWQKYSSETFMPERSRDVVEPLISSLWNQCKYYNDMCPEDAEGVDGHVPVGCVATAMSQLLHYHQYPLQGTGQHSYYSDYGQHSANYGETTYNWDNIPNYLTDYNDDLAQLGYQCGVAVEMNYAPHGSGAYTSNVADALEDYFDYNTAVNYQSKNDYSDVEWSNMLKDNLDDNLPMEYSGSSESSGHAFICDGYQGEDYFHFNWGWDGLFNGYYYLDNLNPRTSNFSMWQGAVLDVYPNHAPEADFAASHINVNVGSSVDFYDLSRYTPNEWVWNFPGAEVESSDEQNPVGITYDTPGDYDVTLMSINRFGPNYLLMENYIHVENANLPIAAFTFADSIITSDQSIVFTDNSLNSPTSWEWDFYWSFYDVEMEFINGTDQYSQNPEVKFPNSGSYSVKLTVENSFGIDEVTNSYIYVGGLPIPYTEDFEIPMAVNDWTVESEDDYISWDGLYFGAGNEPGAKAIGMNFFAYEDIGEVDRLISPLLNFSGKINISLSFLHAYANRPNAKDDVLEILISEDAGITWETIATLSDETDPNFATHTAMDERFIPETEDDWSDYYTFDLDQYEDQPDIKICFQTTNDNGNCLYLDKIQLDSTDLVSAQQDEYEVPNVQLSSYPNPLILSVNGSATISYNLPESSDIELSVYNVKGQKVKELVTSNLSSGKHFASWNGKDSNNKLVSSGVYFYKLKTANYIQTKKLLIIK